MSVVAIEPGKESAGLSDSIPHDRTREEVRALFALPLPDLLFEARRIH